MQLTILGTRYTVNYTSAEECPYLKNQDGVCDTSTKTIYIDKMDRADIQSKGDLIKYRQQVLRHEIIHAYLYESGLDICANWATEEMVDWLAIQADKLFKTFSTAQCIEVRCSHES